MARRSRNKQSNPAPLILGGVAVLAAIVVGYTLLPKGESSQAKSFPLETYTESCNSLRGSEYSVSGEILENFHHDPNVGKFIFLTVEQDASASPDSPQSVGILIPSDVDGPNLETKQKYSFVVSVKKEGMLVAKSYAAQ